MGPLVSAPAEEGFAVCSATGLVAGDRDPGSQHDGLACCGTVCAHGSAVFSGGTAGRGYDPAVLPILHTLPPAPGRPALAATRPGSIRAPPSLVA